MCVIFNSATAQPFVNVKPVIVLDPPLSAACQNSSPASMENGEVFQRLFQAWKNSEDPKTLAWYLRGKQLFQYWNNI